MTSNPQPQPGELWRVSGGFTHAILHSPDIWTVLWFENDEYTLQQRFNLTPVARCIEQPAGGFWADQFDALAQANHLEICWADEIDLYRSEGLAKVLS
ncbi:hypothetical protein [Arthrobacter sp. A2-55]|uniref:hypothetical protein n=1 Tax=Arthrobacter sp. A2-55 TaxID=2897337 RepID=UPI0021CD5207|nr:hypothetical protein [Arthrobacter sp. A2-55]MCU6479087.1 hypothetical protein [Arthrobacter sp. A2-55]